MSSFISDWCRTKDPKGTMEAWSEFPTGIQRGNNFVFHVMERGVECKAKERKDVVELLIMLVDAKELVAENFGTSLKESTLEWLADLVIDIPTIHSNLAELLGPLVVRGVVSLSRIEGQLGDMPSKNVVFDLFGAFVTYFNTEDQAEAASQAASLQAKYSA